MCLKWERLPPNDKQGKNESLGSAPFLSVAMSFMYCALGLAVGETGNKQIREDVELSRSLYLDRHTWAFVFGWSLTSAYVRIWKRPRVTCGEVRGDVSSFDFLWLVPPVPCSHFISERSPPPAHGSAHSDCWVKLSLPLRSQHRFYLSASGA